MPWSNQQARSWAGAVSDIMDALREGAVPRREDFNDEEWQLIEVASKLLASAKPAPKLTDLGSNIVDARRRFRSAARAAAR